MGAHSLCTYATMKTTMWLPILVIAAAMYASGEDAFSTHEDLVPEPGFETYASQEDETNLAQTGWGKVKKGRVQLPYGASVKAPKKMSRLSKLTARWMPKKRPPLGSNRMIVQNIRNVLAYAKVANDKAVDMTAEHKGRDRTSAPVLRLIIELDEARKKYPNIATAFSHAFARTSMSFPEGIGAYVLKSFHKSIRKGKGVVMRTAHSVADKNDFGNVLSLPKKKHKMLMLGLVQTQSHMNAYISLDARTLGFQSNPHYFHRLRVCMKEWKKAKRAISTKGVFKAAKKACLLRGSLLHIGGVKRKLYYKRAARISKAMRRITKGALSKIMRTKVWKNKPSKGIRAAKRTLKINGRITVQSNKQIQARAKRVSKSWAINKGHCDSLLDMMDINRKEKARKEMAIKTAKARAAEMKRKAWVRKEANAKSAKEQRQKRINRRKREKAWKESGVKKSIAAAKARKAQKKRHERQNKHARRVNAKAKKAKAKAKAKAKKSQEGEGQEGQEGQEG